MGDSLPSLRDQHSTLPMQTQLGERDIKILDDNALTKETGGPHQNAKEHQYPQECSIPAERATVAAKIILGADQEVSFLSRPPPLSGFCVSMFS